ncbi:conserved hypothetical protein 2SC10A7.05c [Frigoribacterium sp. JB110]|nr:conserved hypothetical protein 2SC10A7.05c [Frigoribacterium sp. JB110]
MEGGFHAASSDPAQITGWWRRWPAANIGVPTGAVSGLVVVDVDVHGPVDGRASFDRAAAEGLVTGWEALVRTPTGGMHAYYPVTPGIEQRSWQAGGAGVDFRGDGGYIIVPPSARTIDGAIAVYRIMKAGAGPASRVDGRALRDFLDPRPEPRPRPGAGDPVGRADAERLARWLGRQDTDRNLKLFWASCRLAEGGVPMADALDAVLTAAKSDFGPREITATVRSAYRAVHPAPARQASSERAGGGWFARTAPARSAPTGRGL